MNGQQASLCGREVTVLEVCSIVFRFFFFTVTCSLFTTKVRPEEILDIVQEVFFKGDMSLYGKQGDRDVVSAEE